MASYRVAIPYSTVQNPDPGRVLRFVAELDAADVPEARTRGLAAFRELALSTGLRIPNNPTANDVFIEEFDPRADVALEIAALEFQPGVFCMSLTGPLEGATALHLDKEVYRLQHQGLQALILDFGRVHPLSSAGLGVLLNLHDRLDLQLVRVPLSARKILQTLGLESALPFYDSFPEALADQNEGLPGLT